MLTLSDAQERLLPLVGKTYQCPKTANKGAVGLLLEDILGVPHGPRCLDCEDGELKVFPLKANSNGDLVPKETIAVTMLTPTSVVAEPFAASRAFKKLEKTLYVPYLRTEDTIVFMKPCLMEASNPAMSKVYETFAEDYESIRANLVGGGVPSSSMGKYLQNRTKGAGGDAPKTRAFYLRTGFIREFIMS